MQPREVPSEEVVQFVRDNLDWFNDLMEKSIYPAMRKGGIYMHPIPDFIQRLYFYMAYGILANGGFKRGAPGKKESSPAAEDAAASAAAETPASVADAAATSVPTPIDEMDAAAAAAAAPADVGEEEAPDDA